MSYNFRDDAGLFGPGAGVEINNGAGASASFKFPLVEYITFNAVAAGNAVNTIVFTAPAAASAATGALPLGSYSLIEVNMRAVTPVTSGVTTLQVERVPSGTAMGSGTNLLSAAVNLTALTANTVTSAFPATNLASPGATLNAGDSLDLLFGGTLTGLTQLTVTLVVARTA